VSREFDTPRNVDRLRRMYEAYNARDIEAFIACCDPAIELVSAFAAVGGEVYHGHDELRRWQRDVEEVWGDHVHAEPEAYFDLGESAHREDALRDLGVSDNQLEPIAP
jgi:hypothetical protein